jgi:hypothetical protein
MNILREIDSLGSSGELELVDSTRVAALRTQFADLLFKYRDLPTRTRAPGAPPS